MYIRFPPIRETTVSSAGKDDVNAFVFLLRLRQSKQILTGIFPWSFLGICFFMTITVGALYGDWLGSMTPYFNNWSISSLTCSNK